MQKITKEGLILISFFLLFISFSSCKGQNSQIQCFSDAQKLMKKKPVYSTVNKALNDTLNAWIARKLKGAWSLRHNEWKVDDAIFFNKDENKAILLILEIDTQKVIKFGVDEYRAPTQDAIQTVFAYLENKSWQFYTYTMPVIVAVRANYGKTDPMTFEELSQIARKETLQSYYKQKSCHINPKIFEIDEAHLKEMHYKFLDNNSPIYQGIQY